MVGFIGLGIMGRPMATNLRKANVPLMVNDAAACAMEPLQKIGAQAATVEELAAGCDVIFTILPNGAISRSVITEALLPHLKEGVLVVDMSSVTPADSQYCAQKLAEKNVGFLDAPVSGGEEGAINGSLAIMVGGSEENYNKALEYFNILGSKAVLVGGVGSGSVTKLANQVIVNLNIAAVSEAMVLAKKAGADPQKVFDAIRGGLAGSRVLEDKAPRMIAGNFVPGGTIKVNHKDINNALQTGHAVDAPMPMTAMLFEIMQSLKINGSIGEDHSAIIRYFERLADIDHI